MVKIRDFDNPSCCGECPVCITTSTGKSACGITGDIITHDGKLESCPIEEDEKCKWILYDYRTIAPREHGDAKYPYWRIPVRYKEELTYCPYCGKEIDYSEIEADIQARKEEE